MKLSRVILLFVALHQVASAQNLIDNGSFDDVDVSSWTASVSYTPFAWDPRSRGPADGSLLVERTNCCGSPGQQFAVQPGTYLYQLFVQRLAGSGAAGVTLGLYAASDCSGAAADLVFHTRQLDETDPGWREVADLAFEVPEGIGCVNFFLRDTSALGGGFGAALYDDIFFGLRAEEVLLMDSFETP